MPCLVPAALQERSLPVGRGMTNQNRRAISLVKPLTKRKDDMNEFMKADVFNRMGDLLSTLGDIEMSIEGRAKQGLRCATRPWAAPCLPSYPRDPNLPPPSACAC